MSTLKGRPEMTETTTVTRFALDEDAARAWLASDDEPGYGEDFSPARDDDDGNSTYLLVTGAFEAGIITDTGRPGDDARGNPSLSWEFIADGDGDGYRWLLYTENTHEPILASWHESMGHLGDGYETTGTEAALAVLREAAEAGNRLAGQAAALPDAQQQLDRHALDAIQHMLRDPEWRVGMLEDIAELVNRTGRSTDNLPGDEPTWARH